VTDPDSGIEHMRALLRQPPGADEYEAIHALDPNARTPMDHARLSEAAWWLSRYEEAVAERQLAYAGFTAASDDSAAGLLAARLAIEYHLQGDPSIAAGFLARAQRHLRSAPDSREVGFLRMIEASLAQMSGRSDDGLEAARDALVIAERFGDRDLLAMALHIEGLLLLDNGHVEQGLTRMDESMVLVLAGELAPFFTGIIYCDLIQACLELSDLGRAGEWCDAAREWSEALPPAAPFLGMCRVNRAEVARIRGSWPEAEAEATLAADELAGIDPGAAGSACYQIGEIHRRTGDLVGAERAYARAHELGADPQPGLALLRLAQRKPDVAAASLRTALASIEHAPHRARLLAAQVEVALARDDVAAARDAEGELAGIAQHVGAAALHAAAPLARGEILLVEGDASAAAEALRAAIAAGRDVRTPFETAQARAAYGRALAATGDDEGAGLEWLAALAAFDDLGAMPDAAAVRVLLGEPDALPRGLTPREAEVLRLLSAGKTNRDIAVELVISEHTVGRHLQNMYAKLGVSSRSAATAFAFEHGLA
jgi:DNA-binding NarL/FixJ family response regulator